MTTAQPPCGRPDPGSRDRPRGQGRLPAGRRVIATGWESLGGAGTVLALLVLASMFIAVAGPRESLDLRTRALEQTLAGRPAADSTVEVDAPLISFPQGLPPGLLAALGARFRRDLAVGSLPLDPAADWAGLSSPYGSVKGAGRGAVNGTVLPQLELLYRDPLGRNARLAAGRMPSSSSVAVADGEVTAASFEVAVTQRIAARFGLRPGSRLLLNGPSQDVSLTVTGVLRPLAPRSAFWTSDPAAAAPFLNGGTNGSPPYWTGSAFVGPAELPNLEQVFEPKGMSITWDFPLAIKTLNADQAGPALARLTAVANGALIDSGVNELSVTSGLFTQLPGFIATQSATQTILMLLVISLVALGAVAVLLAALLLAERRDAELSLLRARGASLAQLGAYTLAGGALAVLPAAAVGVLAGVAATPGPAAGLSWRLAALAFAVAVAGPPLISLRRQLSGQASARAGGRHVLGEDVSWWRRGAPASPRDRGSRSPGGARARRVIADLTVAVACAGGLAVLRLQGLPRGGSANLYVSAAPVLVAAPVSVAAARLLPPALRWALRLAARGRGAALFLGLARAARDSGALVLPMFGLVLALVVVSFGAMTRSAIERGQEAASWQSAGTDAVIAQANANSGITPALARAVRAAAGVRRIAAATVTPGTTVGRSAIQIVAVDPATYAALTAQTPFPPLPAGALDRPARWRPGSPAPAIASPLAAHLLGPGAARLSTGAGPVTVRVAATLASTPAAPGAGVFVIVPSWAEPALRRPDLLLITGPQVNGRALLALAGRMLPGSAVTIRSQVLRSLANAPLPHSASVAFATGAIAAGGLGVLVLLLSLTLSARARETALARLATIGLDRGQARRLSMLEAAPSLLAAVAGGVVCAAALPPLIGPVVDLSPFTGAGGRVAFFADPAALGAATALLLAVTGTALVIQTGLAARRGAARALRAGG